MVAATARMKTRRGQVVGYLEAEEGPHRATFFLEFTLIFAVVAMLLSLAAGFAVSRFLASDVRNSVLIAIGATLAALYVPLLILLRGSNTQRRQQASLAEREQDRVGPVENQPDPEP